MSPTRRRVARPAPLDPADGARSAGDGAGADPRAAGAPRGSFGQWLRGQREARAVELAEIAEESKISLRYLNALEQDRFDILPAPVFVRGFLREYARVVGLDADEVVNLFLVSAPRVASDRRPEPASPSSSAGYSDSGGSSFGRGLLIAVVVLLVLGIAAGVAYWAALRSAPKPAARPLPAESTAPEVRLPQPAIEPTAAQPSAIEPIQGSAPEPVATGLSTPTSPPAAPPLPAPAPPEARSPLVVVLAFQQDCWVETRIDGGRRTSELRAGGETLTLEAGESIVLTLGNAPAVKAELNGRPLAFPTDASRLLRDFRIDRELIAEPPGVGEQRRPSPGAEASEPSRPEQPAGP